ncbi:hypothetical protein FVER53590_29932 [Fusarium verticillioides]|nr:hypothetical protein FVER53590_29932 [Fusarium verticillioides]
MWTVSCSSLVARRRTLYFCFAWEMRRRKNKGPCSPHCNFCPSFFSTKTFTLPSFFRFSQQHKKKQTIKLSSFITKRWIIARMLKLSSTPDIG